MNATIDRVQARQRAGTPGPALQYDRRISTWDARHAAGVRAFPPQAEAAKCCTFVNHRKERGLRLWNYRPVDKLQRGGSASSSYHDSAARDCRGADVTSRKRAWKRYGRVTFAEWLTAIVWAAFAVLVVVFSFIVIGGFLNWLTSPTFG